MLEPHCSLAESNVTEVQGTSKTLIRHTTLQVIRYIPAAGRILWRRLVPITSLADAVWN